MIARAFAAEILRNARIQLRPKRLIAAAVICLAASFTAIAYVFYSPSADPPRVAGQNLLEFTFSIQVAALLIGGGLYCLQSVHREKELNTFDYQRVTRLTPLELAVGKLFGPPAMMYFVVLCTMPLIVVSAYLSSVSVPGLLAAYLLFLLGCVTYHAFALFISLFLPKGTSAGTVILFLIMIYVTSSGGASDWSTGVITRLSPFYAMPLISHDLPRGTRDVFFGMTIAHGYVLLALYLTLTAWFLLAINRNMKRDPTDYEIYSPLQALGFVLYSDLLFLGFFHWIGTKFSPAGDVANARLTPSEAEPVFLFTTFWLFLILGLTLLRNRDRARRRIRELGASAADWWASLWPSQYVVVGVFLCGAAFMFELRRRLDLNLDSSTGMAVFEIAYLAIWLIRDLVFLQWANLRRSRRPLFSGVIYLIAYYGCALALFSLIALRSSAGRIVYGSALFPGAAFGIHLDSWTRDRTGWLMAMIVLAAEAFVFIYLQRRTLQQILSSAPRESAVVRQPLTPQ